LNRRILENFAMATTTIISGQTASGVGVTSGNTVNIQSGGVVNSATVAKGGVISGADGATLTGVITDGGTISGGLLSGAGTVETVSSGAVIANQTIGSGASARLLAYTSAGRNLVVSGGTLDLYSNNTTNTTIVGTGGTFILESGVTFTAASGNYATDGNTIDVMSGAVLASSYVRSGGVINVQGGVVSNTFVDGGTLNVFTSNGGTNNTTFTSNGGTVNLESGFKDSRSWVVSNNVTFNVASGATIATTTVRNGGSLVIESGGVLSGSATVSSGGTVTLNGTAGSGTINLAGDGASMVISGTDMPTNTISGFTTNDQIDLASIPQSSITNVSRQNNQIVITTQGGSTYTLNAPGASNYGYQLISDGHGGTIYTTCFAEGTMIATPDGEIAVEDVTEGMMVSTPKGAFPVKWLGHRTITVADQRVPEENWLVRIRAGALADNVPVRDLLITQEHCMVFDDRLVPARMLVNGTSIIIDRGISAYTYYHVELDSHEAIWAEGALTESYLDTGNRDQFENHAVTVMFAERVAGGSENLPLDTSRAFVEPIHSAIAARAGIVADGVATTDDADMHLVTDTGAVIRAHRVNGAQHVFRLPEGVAAVVLASRTSRPSDVIGPFVDDRRDLGVLVSEIRVFSADATATVEVPFLEADLPGWDIVEATHCRWTNGNAVLPIGHAYGTRLLSIKVQAKGPYRARGKIAAVA